MKTLDLGRLSPATMQGIRCQADFFSRYLCWKKKVVFFFQIRCILNYVSLGFFKQKSKGNKCVSVQRMVGPRKSSQWSHLVGLCQVLLQRMNLISSLWNEGIWASKPQSPIKWDMTINRSTEVCLSPPHLLTFMGGWSAPHSQCYSEPHDAFSKTHVEDVAGLENLMFIKYFMPIRLKFFISEKLRGAKTN